MDPVTHFCSGIVAKNFLTKKSGITTTLIFGLVSMSPDIDNFIGISGNPFLYLLHHRGFTHSFVGGFILAYILYIITKIIKYFDDNLLLNFYILILIHILLDLFTNYGTQIFLPFSNSRVGLNAIFIIDPIYLIILIILYFTTKKRVFTISSFHPIFLTFILIFTYPVITYLIKTTYELKLKGNNPNTIVATAPFSPIFWKIIEDKGDNYQMYLSYKSDEKLIYKKPDRDLYEILNKDENLKIFRWFLKYPYVNIKKENNKTIYELADLRFEFPFRENPFVLKIIVEKDNVSYLFRHYKKNL